MKRSHTPPLLRSVMPTRYLIDTSAWSNIDDRPESEKIWALIISLIKEERIVTPSPVLNEARAEESLARRLKPYEKQLLSGDRDGDDVEYLLHIGKVTHDHPGMARARGRKTRADSYVVALAELEGYVVVTDETLHRPNRKIPGVCKRRGIRCIGLDEFIEEVRGEDRTGTADGMNAGA